jgi:CheY-like chemotaxis protein
MKKVKVMIVEDDPMVSFLHKALIVKRDISSSPKDFMNGMEALDFILDDYKKDQEAFYLILLDINMPIMNGWEFLEALKDCEVAKRTEVVIVTSSPDRDDREKAKSFDLVTDYLEKPLINFEPVIKIKRDLEQKVL